MRFRNLLNFTLQNQLKQIKESVTPINTINRNQQNRTLLNQNLLNHIQESAKLYSAEQESAKTGIRNLLNLTLLNRNMLSHYMGIC